MHSALSLIGMFMAMAGLFLELQAEFVAWILIIVYTGAVMVLMIFVISLLNLQRDEPIQLNLPRNWGIAAVGIFCLVFLVYLYRDPRVGFVLPQKWPVPAEWGSVSLVAEDLFTRYLLPFELASLVLTAAVIGAVVIARAPDADSSKER